MFERLDERQVSVTVEAVAVEDVVELVVVHADVLAHVGELAQKRPVVLLFARDGAQVQGEVRPLLAPQLRVRVQLDARLERGVFPLLARPVEVDRVGEALTKGARGVLGRLLALDVVGVHAAMGGVAFLGGRGFGGHLGVGAALVGTGGGRCGVRVALLGALAAAGIAAARALGGEHAVPRLVVVRVERRAQFGQLLVGKPFVREVAVHRLGGGQRQGGVDARERGLLARGAGGARGRQVELADDALHDDVASRVPAGDVHLLAGVGVQKHVVQHDVQVGARERGGLGGVQARDRRRVVAQVRAIGGERRAGNRQKGEAREGRAHEPQVHEQGVPCEVEGLPSKLIDRFGGHGGSFDGWRVRRRRRVDAGRSAGGLRFADGAARMRAVPASSGRRAADGVRTRSAAYARPLRGVRTACRLPSPLRAV